MIPGNEGETVPAMRHQIRYGGMRMKKLVTSLVMILCLSGFLRLPIAGAASMCNEAIDFGYLEIENVDQQETPWCWVASANAVTNHFGLNDPANSNLYTQCRLYNIAKSPGVDCCTHHSDPVCQRTGWPYEVFNNLNPKIDYYGEGNPMNWPEIQGQICPNWRLGRPFIFIAKPHQSGLLAHTHVVKGFDHDIVGAPQLWIDDHFGNGPRVIDYECKYKLPANCQVPTTQWDRVGDLKDLKAVNPNPDLTPPATPQGLSSQ